MKRGLARGLHRLVASSTSAGCKPVSLFNDGGVRTMATSSEILLASSQAQERVAAAEKTMRESPHLVAKPRWYRPDPVTGMWLPSAGSEDEKSEEMSATGIIVPADVPAQIRAESTDSMVDKRWWTSMEELPDMDRHKDLKGTY